MSMIDLGCQIGIQVTAMKPSRYQDWDLLVVVVSGLTFCLSEPGCFMSCTPLAAAGPVLLRSRAHEAFFGFCRFMVPLGGNMAEPLALDFSENPTIEEHAVNSFLNREASAFMNAEPGDLS